MKDGYLTVIDAYLATFLGAAIGAAIVMLLFAWMITHDRLCVRGQDGARRCVQVETRPAR